MPRVKDRSMELPYGWQFSLPEIKWKSTPGVSLETHANAAESVAKANPFLAKKYNWPTTHEGWLDKIDQENAARIRAMGPSFAHFITEGGGGGPFPESRSPLQFAGRAVAGASVLAEMWGKEGPIRDRDLANRRAATCVTCPKHDKGDWTRWFTKPAQALIIKSLAMVKDLDLRTDHDSELQVCTACGCPMKGKVWARLEHILKHIPAEDKAELDPGCWILKETAAPIRNDYEPPRHVYDTPTV